MSMKIIIPGFLFCCLILFIYECSSNEFKKINEQFHLVSEAYTLATNLFQQGSTSYNGLKNKSLHTIDTFLDLVHIINDQMAMELRSAVLKFYKIKSLHDFTNYVISMDDIIDIIEHCLYDPVEKLDQIRSQFHGIIQNFQDVRNFDTVDKCHKELPDEVAAAHCLLHLAVLFNETMQESLVSIVEIKTRQHAREMNTSMYGVQKCINNFVPKFFDLLLLDAYTTKCHYLKVVNASVADLMKDKWRGNETIFTEKWSPFVRILKKNGGSLHYNTIPSTFNFEAGHEGKMLKGSLLLSLFNSNATSNEDL